MAINRKGSRKITVNGEVYYWRVRDNWDNISIVIQHQDAKHQFLIFKTASGVMLNGKTPPITPSIIRKAIERALANGWDPFSEVGKPTTVEFEIPKEWTFEGFWKTKELQHFQQFDLNKEEIRKLKNSKE